MSSNTPEFNTEEPVRVNHRARNIVIAVVVVVALAVAAYFGYRAMNKNDNAQKGSETNRVVSGVVGATEPPWVEFTKQRIAQVIYVEIKDFQDYTSENPALDGDKPKYTHLSQLPAGSSVAIPNDDTNHARALGVLKAAGLITV